MDLYLLGTLVLKTDSDCPFGIFQLFLINQMNDSFYILIHYNISYHYVSQLSTYC